MIMNRKHTNKVDIRQFLPLEKPTTVREGGINVVY